MIRVPEDDFNPPSILELRTELPQWEHESDAEYEKRLDMILEIRAVGYRLLNARREARLPLYPIADYFEARISSGFDRMRRLVASLGTAIVVLLVVIALAVLRR